MENEQLFRWLFIVIFVAAFSISVYFRRKARKSSEVIPRAREGRLSILLRFLFAAPLYLSILGYMLNPNWMAWSSLPLPAWLRWAGAVVGLGTVPLLYWVFRTVGKNISETYLTKESHALVTHGPYRWIRHPLYTVATVAFLSLGVLAANWLILVMAFLVLGGITFIVIPREEDQLIQKFGDEYREYQQRTGMLVPRL